MVAADKIRRPPGGSESSIWRMGVLLCVPAIIFTICFIACHVVFGSAFHSTIFGMAGLVVSLVPISFVLFVPQSNRLSTYIEGLQKAIDESTNGMDVANSQLQKIAAQINQLESERNQLFSSIDYQRQQLLAENWKAMRGVEFENYLARVFQSLGYHVETTRTSGDQGVDLVVQIGHRRIAIQAKGYVNSVGNAAVQQAVAGKSIYNCGFSAVITNSRFTNAAIELASANHCVLISEDNFCEFVMGRVQLFAY